MINPYDKHIYLTKIIPAIFNVVQNIKNTKNSRLSLNFGELTEEDINIFMTDNIDKFIEIILDVGEDGKLIVTSGKAFDELVNGLCLYIVHKELRILVKEGLVEMGVDEKGEIVCWHKKFNTIKAKKKKKKSSNGK